MPWWAWVIVGVVGGGIVTYVAVVYWLGKSIQRNL